MHIAIGYRWFPTAAAFHLERALVELGHRVTYVGLPCADRSGYDSAVPINEVIGNLSELPDLYLWVDPAGRYFPAGIEDLPFPTACYLIDVHLGEWRKQAARFFDAVFIAQKDFLEGFRRMCGHDQVYWLPLAAAPDVHKRTDVPRTYDVGFVGNIVFAHRKTARVRRLKAISGRWVTNDFYRTYSPAEVGDVYSRSRIVFNTSIAGDVTMRIFEGTACGALVLTDSVANGLEELFHIGREIVTFEDDDDLWGKIDHYLQNETERARIAEAGYERTCSQHTYVHRMEWMLERIRQPAFERTAPMRDASPTERWRASREIYTHLHMLDAILDALREMRCNPVLRAWQSLPCLLRRWLF